LGLTPICDSIWTRQSLLVCRPFSSPGKLGRGRDKHRTIDVNGEQGAEWVRVQMLLGADLGPSPSAAGCCDTSPSCCPNRGRRAHGWGQKRCSSSLRCIERRPLTFSPSWRVRHIGRASKCKVRERLDWRIALHYAKTLFICAEVARQSIELYSTVYTSNCDEYLHASPQQWKVFLIPTTASLSQSRFKDAVACNKPCRPSIPLKRHATPAFH
jgi:hypothetical protein